MRRATSAIRPGIAEVRLIDMRGYDEERPEETLKTCVAYGPRTLERLVEDGYCDVA